MQIPSARKTLQFNSKCSTKFNQGEGEDKWQGDEGRTRNKILHRSNPETQGTLRLELSFGHDWH